MKKLGHIEAEKTFGAEEVLCEFERQLRLPHSGRPEKKERAKRFPSGLQSELAAFQNRAHAGNDVVLPFDPGKQVRLETVQIAKNGCIVLEGAHR